MTRTETVAVDVGYGDDTLGWDLMTQNNSHKKQARDLQARTGMPYTRALREVAAITGGASANQDRPAELLPAMLLPPPLTDSPDGSGPAALQALPFGRTPDGVTLVLDLNDAHASGNGPHALLVGMTGAGKSTLLHTLAYGLCAQQSPASMRMVFVHGRHHLPAAMSDFADYPHVTAISGPDTALEVLRGIANDDPVVPRTVVIIDDYDVEQPETLGQLELLMRVGPSRGIHVVVACQQSTAGSTDRLTDNAAVRIALRTVTEQHSQDVIGTSDAAYLPHTPSGLGLYVDTPGDTPIPFQSLKTPRALVRSTAAQLLDDQSPE